jgi:endonuclease-3 related protein
LNQREALRDVYERLLDAYGLQHWWPGESAFEVVVGAILTQSAAWTNVEKALGNLRAAGALSPRALLRLDEGEIAALIRPSGHYNAKARKLKASIEVLFGRFDGHLHCLLRVEMEELRGLLLSTHGIGPETADSIVLYAAGKPSFVIDAYTRRLFSRLGARHGKDACRKRKPLCADCQLLEVCPMGGARRTSDSGP